MTSERRQLEMADVAFDENGKCIKHRYLSTCIGSALHAAIDEGMNPFELADMLKKGKARLKAIQCACDHVYKNRKSQFYCKECGYHYVEHKLLGSAIKRNNSPLF